MDELKGIAAELNGCAVGDVLAVTRLEDGGLVSVVRTGEKRRFSAAEAAGARGMPAAPEGKRAKAGGKGRKR